MSGWAQIATRDGYGSQSLVAFDVLRAQVGAVRRTRIEAPEAVPGPGEG
jgi:hypothetical protein